jgi:ABC-type dipeptide/oligopeptide/nickel transport system permease component
MIGVSIPSFWEAIMLIYLLGVCSRSCRPRATCRSPRSLQNLQVDAAADLRARHPFGGPAGALRALQPARGLGQDYIRTARAKGFSERAVVACTR